MPFQSIFVFRGLSLTDCGGVKVFLQQCALRSQDFAIIYHKEYIVFENPDQCGSALSPDSVRKISRIFQCISPRAENILTAIKTLLIIIFYLTVYAAQVPTSAWDITVARRPLITPLPVATCEFDSTAITRNQALAFASTTRQ